MSGTSKGALKWILIAVAVLVVGGGAAAWFLLQGGTTVNVEGKLPQGQGAAQDNLTATAQVAAQLFIEKTEGLNPGGLQLFGDAGAANFSVEELTAEKAMVKGSYALEQSPASFYDFDLQVVAPAKGYKIKVSGFKAVKVFMTTVQQAEELETQSWDTVEADEQLTKTLKNVWNEHFSNKGRINTVALQTARLYIAKQEDADPSDSSTAIVPVMGQNFRIGSVTGSTNKKRVTGRYRKGVNDKKVHSFQMTVYIPVRGTEIRVTDWATITE